MKTTITIHHPGDPLLPLHADHRIPVKAGWYRHAQFSEQRLFAPRQLGRLEGWYGLPGAVVLCVRVMAVRDEDF